MLRFISIFALSAFCLGCGPKKVENPLVGTYVHWIFIDGQARSTDNPNAKNQITLKSDGTYEYEGNTTAMMVFRVRAQGKFKVTKNKIVFSGTANTVTDTGNGEKTHHGPHEMTMKLVDGMLEEVRPATFTSLWRKEGSGPPPLPKNLQLSKSELAATELVARVESTYGSLNSFKATGTVSSYGGGYVATDANFSILFERPSKFRLEAFDSNSKVETDRTKVTWDGAETCWWYNPEFGVTTNRSLANAIGITSVHYGPQIKLLYSLLMPDDPATQSIDKKFPEATLLPEEKINGRACSVLNLRTNNADATKLWVDKETAMIVRIFEEMREVTVEIDSKPNVKIKPSELMLGERSKPTAL